MTLEDAMNLIGHGVNGHPGIWADIGAGTGMFTKALLEILNRGNGSNRGNRESGESRIYAVDKNPHALWELKRMANVELEIVEADFNKPIDLPPLDGIVMANALHYAEDHLLVLKNVITSLKTNGTFILVEYETETPRPPWVPHPVSFKKFENLCASAGLRTPSLIGKIQSVYGADQIYSACATRL